VDSNESNVKKVDEMGAIPEALQFSMPDPIFDLTSLLQTLRTQKSVTEKELMNAIIHKFSNHLATIHGYSQLVLKRIGKDDPSRNELERIIAASEKVAQLARELLYLAAK